MRSPETGLRAVRRLLKSGRQRTLKDLPAATQSKSWTLLDRTLSRRPDAGPGKFSTLAWVPKRREGKPPSPPSQQGVSGQFFPPIPESFAPDLGRLVMSPVHSQSKRSRELTVSIGVPMILAHGKTDRCRALCGGWRSSSRVGASGLRAPRTCGNRPRLLPDPCSQQTRVEVKDNREGHSQFSRNQV